MTFHAQSCGVQRDDIVTIEYNAKLENGATVLSTTEEGPLTFKVGEFPLVEGLNDAVIGMKLGETKRVLIKPDFAFGKFESQLLEEYPLSKLPNFIRIGQRIFLHGRRPAFNVLSVDTEEGTATLDGNHVLAGKDLIFYIKLICVKMPPSIKVNYYVEQNHCNQETTRSRKEAQKVRKEAKKGRTPFREKGNSCIEK